MGDGVLGTASPPSLELTMVGLDHTQAWQPVPSTATGVGVSLLRPGLWSGSPHDSKIPREW